MAKTFVKFEFIKFDKNLKNRYDNQCRLAIGIAIQNLFVDQKNRVRYFRVRVPNYKQRRKIPCSIGSSALNTNYKSRSLILLKNYGIATASSLNL